MLVGAEGVLGTQARDKRHAVPTDRRMPEAAAAAALFAALPRAAGLVRGRGAPGAQLCILAADAHFSACALCGSPGQSCAHGLHGTAPAHTGSPLPTNCPGNMSRVEAAAATRDYALKPRLEYRTVAGVNGPLVILEVRSLRPTYWERTGQTSELCVWAFWVSALSSVDACSSPPDCGAYLAHRVCAGRDSPRS